MNINSDPYGNGWMVKLKVSNQAELNDLLDAKAYEVRSSLLLFKPSSSSVNMLAHSHETFRCRSTAPRRLTKLRVVASSRLVESQGALMSSSRSTNKQLLSLADHSPRRKKNSGRSRTYDNVLLVGHSHT